MHKFKKEKEYKVLSPLKKRQKKTNLNKVMKEMILNMRTMYIFYTFNIISLQLNCEAAIIDIAEHATSATGVSLASVF